MSKNEIEHNYEKIYSRFSWTVSHKMDSMHFSSEKPFASVGVKLIFLQFLVENQ